MGAPDAVVELVERFRHNFTTYLNPAYNETQVRIEFIDPFFKALGWDVDNSAGNAPQYRDVVHEDAIKVGIDSRAPDYSFRVGGARKFFVEAKKPAVNLKDDPSPAYQLRRYAWSAKLPLSIVTDFQEFVVYDCRVRPANTDKAPVARIMYATFAEYEHRWDEIASIFSKDAIYKGSFDQYAESTKAKKGTAEVDTAFLKEIETWRDELARNIALRNRSLSTRQLNYAVQATIDRIIFLRICEDRLIEPYGRLQGLVNGQNVWERLRTLFFEADHRYNSGLFHFEQEKGRADAPDTLTPDLVIDDRVLKEILKRLYYPESPYEFSVLPADILGQVYEQFLGKVIRLTTGHQAKVEDKPEVKKAGGVYYTPTYIVDYIVKNTVGRLLEGLTPKQAADLRILDPACGSGSFLIGAYQCLLDWHRDWYVEHALDKKNKPIVQGRAGEWQLTTAEKKRILLNNIYGVDIDAQAVETTKLSLLLKVLEGETSETIDAQLSFLHERALPDLAANIKCGNSLIGPDFYDDQQLGLTGLDDEERYRINVFDWEAEFPQILGTAVPEARRGFDAVIGNPPYVRQEGIAATKPYLERTYEVFTGTADLYAYFIERSLKLARPGGLFSFIVSNKFCRSGYGDRLRRLIPRLSRIIEFLDFGDLPVFPNATVYPCVFLVERVAEKDGVGHNSVVVCNVDTLGFTDLGAFVAGAHFEVDQTELSDGAWLLIPPTHVSLVRKMDAAGVPLSAYAGCEPLRGILTGLNEVFVVREDDIDRITKGDIQERDVFLPYLRGRNVHRYWHEPPSEWLLFSDGLTTETYPNVMSYLEGYHTSLAARTDIMNTSKEWFELRPCRYYDLVRQPKIIYSSVAQRGTFVLDPSGVFVDKTCYFLPSTDKYLLALLNSRLMLYYFSHIAVQRRGGYFEYLTQYVAQLPIVAKVDGDERFERLAQLADRLQMRTVERGDSRTQSDRTILDREIANLDSAVDYLVYDLYALTDDEIAVVESSVEKA